MGDAVGNRVVVVGSGIAGLTCACALAERGFEVQVVSPGEPGRDGASHRLHGMAPFILVAAPWVRGDSPGLFAADLDRRADGLRRPGLGEVLAEVAHDAARELMAWLDLRPIASEPIGLPGDGLARGLPCLPGHSRALLQPALASCAAAGVHLEGRTLVVGLVREGERVTGVMVVRRGSTCLERLAAMAVVLACGGPAGAFPVSTGPRWCRGSNLVLGSLVGALLHHPGLLQALPLTERPPGFFLTSRVLVEARLAADGEPLDHDHTVPGMLEVMRAATWAGRRLTIALDPSARELLPASFPIEAIAPVGTPVGLAVGCHHGIGGVAVDAWGRTSVPGLYACGEAAGGVQGRGRMMGTGLLEGFVFGRRAAAAIARDGRRLTGGSGDSAVLAPPRASAIEPWLDDVTARWLVDDPGASIEAPRESAVLPGGFDEYLAALRLRAVEIMAAAGRE